jgi:hypothetical protein
MSKRKGSGTKSRSAINGRYVSKRYANAHKRTTVNESTKSSKKK